MPELPEVQTTATILNKPLRGLQISDVWTDYGSAYHKGQDNIKDQKFFKEFKRRTIGAKFESVNRRGKNVLLNLDNGETVIVHMKMTGHLLYGAYKRISNSQSPQPGTSFLISKKIPNKLKTEEKWVTEEKGPLQDFRNQFIHFVISLSNGKYVVLSDMRKFAKITVVQTTLLSSSTHLGTLGPEPLEKSFGFNEFKKRLLIKPKGKIKQVLMNPEIIAGIGNIYSDEILFTAEVHPLSIVSKIPEKILAQIFTASKEILQKGINLGGDSTSDYRNPLGVHGKFHHHHQAYRNTGKPCSKKGCEGIIKKIRLGGRSAHFCDTHQNEYV